MQIHSYSALHRAIWNTFRTKSISFLETGPDSVGCASLSVGRATRWFYNLILGKSGDAAHEFYCYIFSLQDVQEPCLNKFKVKCIYTTWAKQPGEEQPSGNSHTRSRSLAGTSDTHQQRRKTCGYILVNTPHEKQSNDLHMKTLNMTQDTTNNIVFLGLY